MQVYMGQINTFVGDFRGNTDKVLSCCQAIAQHSPEAIVVFPELTLSGYPPEDLLLRPSIVDHVEGALHTLLQHLPPSLTVVVGYPRRLPAGLFNTAGVLQAGRLIGEYHKAFLPNYQVFDEKRYFSAGSEAFVFTLKDVCFGITICEDIWNPAPAALAKAAGADVLINLNASPFHRGKVRERQQLLAVRATENHLPIIYVNQVGGQDELVFDGGSFAVDARGSICVQAPEFAEGVYSVVIGRNAQHIAIEVGQRVPLLDDIPAIWQALVLGLRDYVEKNRFSGVILGLSGGIDSAVTLALAVDALGAERVEAVMMPFRYTASMSIEDAQKQADVLGVHYRALSIEPLYDVFMETLAEEFASLPPNIAEENLQARCRGVLLMSISNKRSLLVLTTGNKSELAVGYSTLYGDMAGGFDALKDCPKMLVYALARYRNSLGECIPQRVIERAPSAELAPDQKDEDSLPPYEVLDQIIERYVEGDESADDIIAAGFTPGDVQRVLRLIDLNEYKRRQAPVGVRITQRGFGRDRRYPITWSWR
jgi:NAD+ synthase (glutamine-hydrolysing)